MNFGKEFEKYAVKHKGISSNTLDSYMKHNIPNAVASIPQPTGVAVGDITTLLKSAL
jgi:ATP-dependent Clp protease protease subunit